MMIQDDPGLLVVADSLEPFFLNVIEIWKQEREG
jgi:hypothetical protein